MPTAYYRELHYWMLKALMKKEYETSMEYNDFEKQLLLIGDLWEKYERIRIYLANDVVNEICGLHITRYDTGNISCAVFNGEKLSNKKASKLAMRDEDQFWYSMYDKEFKWKNTYVSNYIFELADTKIREKYNG